MKEKVLVLGLAGERRWKLCAWREAWEALLSSISPSPPGVSWSFILTSSLLDRTWKETCRRLARGWEICWMKENQESRAAQLGEEEKEEAGRDPRSPRGQDSQALGMSGSPWKLPDSLPSQQLSFIRVLEKEVKAEPWAKM